MTDLTFPEFHPGEVWLVGAGPGDPRLLTLLAVHALRSGDVIVHDELIDRRVLEFASAGAEIMSAGKRGGKPSAHQADINERLVELARAGRKVVRLKGGDPFVFGRGGEEAITLARAGVPFRIVPGLTSGLTAAALAGIPATTRQTNHAVILATGHRALDDEAMRDWAAMARTGQPIIFYMAISNLDRICTVLRDAGMEVVYTGLHRTPEEVVTAAVQEDVDVLGISLLSGTHMTAFPNMLKLLENEGADDIIVVGGGVIPENDAQTLKTQGVAAILSQDTPPAQIVETIRQLVAERGPR